LFVEGLKDWWKGGLVDDEEDMCELNPKEDDVDGFYEGGRPVEVMK
jgi:hypothetical protein